MFRAELAVEVGDVSSIGISCFVIAFGRAAEQLEVDGYVAEGAVVVVSVVAAMRVVAYPSVYNVRCSVTLAPDPPQFDDFPAGGCFALSLPLTSMMFAALAFPAL